jgi:hypothetical protein
MNQFFRAKIGAGVQIYAARRIATVAIIGRFRLILGQNW